MSGQETYDKMETPTLVNLLVDPARPPETLRMALVAIAGRSESHRTPGLTAMLECMVRHPNGYELSLMTEALDVLVVEPDAEITRTLLATLQDIAGSVLTDAPTQPDFRAHFYTTILTRQNDADLAIWGEVLPALGPDAIAGLILDPIADEIREGIDPRTLLQRLSEPHRTQAQFSLIIGVIRGMGSIEDVQTAVGELRESNDPAALTQGVEMLITHWEEAKAAGRDNLVKNLGTILRRLDKRPRTASEKLMGKRPWAK